MDDKDDSGVQVYKDVASSSAHSAQLAGRPTPPSHRMHPGISLQRRFPIRLTVKSATSNVSIVRDTLGDMSLEDEIAVSYPAFAALEKSGGEGQY